MLIPSGEMRINTESEAKRAKKQTIGVYKTTTEYKR